MTEYIKLRRGYGVEFPDGSKLSRRYTSRLIDIVGSGQEAVVYRRRAHRVGVLDSDGYIQYKHTKAARRPMLRFTYYTTAILQAVADGYEYGLDVIEQTSLAVPTVYQTLKRLEREGYVLSHWEEETLAVREGRPQRKFYRLTESGSDALAAALPRFPPLQQRKKRKQGVMGSRRPSPARS